MKHIQNENINTLYIKEFETIKSTVLPRTILITLIIGSFINLINQFNVIFSSDSLQILPLLLTYITPFAVVLYAQHTSLNKAYFDVNANRINKDVSNLLSTLLSHGILEKALVIGLIAGSVNSIILLTVNYIKANGFDGLQTSLIIQFYLIPLFFGALTQTLSYRRAILIFSNQEERTAV